MAQETIWGHEADEAPLRKMTRQQAEVVQTALMPERRVRVRLELEFPGFVDGYGLVDSRPSAVVLS